MRRCVIASLAVLAAVSGQVATIEAAHASGQPAESAGPAEGSYVALSAFRLVDTRASGAIPSQQALNFQVTGRGSVPASGVGAVALTISTVGPAASGELVAYASQASPPATTTMRFVAGDRVSTSAVIAVTSSGSIAVFNRSSAALHVVIDVSGYYRSGVASVPGAYSAVSPARILDTRSTAPLSAGQAVAVQVTGRGGLPSDIAAVVATVTVYGPTATGSLLAWRSGVGVPGGGAVQFSAGRSTSGVIELPLSASGKVTLLNQSAGKAHVLVDVIGYYMTGPPTMAGTFGSVGSSGTARVLDTRTGVAGNRKGAVPARSSVAVTIAGKGGVPKWNVAAVVGRLTAIAPAASGSATVYQGQKPAPGTTNLQFAAGRNASDLVVVPLSSAGQIALFNKASKAAHFVFDVTGYYLKAALPVPGGAMSHYIRTTSSLATMGHDDAVADAAIGGAHVHLLHIGAQTNKGLGGAKGVLLSATTTRMTYGALVNLIKGYLSGYASAHTGTAALVVVGTNNDGDFSAYNGSTKGADWARSVINPLRAVAPYGLDVRGGADIEAGFAGSLASAKAWISAYLASTRAPLVYTGSADACPDTYRTSADCAAVRDDGGVLKRWRRADYVQLAYGLGPGRIKVLPQVYFYELPNQAMQWININVTSGLKLLFLGALTEHASACGSACAMTSGGGWATFWNAMAASGVGTPQVVTDLRVN